MDSNELIRTFGFAILGLAAGTLSGLLGIGGAVVIIPALVFIFGFDQKLAQGTTLLLMVPPIGILAALQYYRSGHVDIKAGAIIAALFFVGGFFGAKLADLLDPSIMRKVFAVCLAGIAVKMFFD
jgi:uncharacterized membrane protein YfcA